MATNKKSSKRLKSLLSCSMFILLILGLLSCNGEHASETAYRGTVVPTITLLTTTREYDPARYFAAYAIAQWWEELGLDVSVKALDFAELTDAIRDSHPEIKDWHAFLYAWTGRVERADPDMFLYSITHSSQIVPVGNNIYKYSNPEYDALAETQRRIADPEIRRIVVHEAQKKLAEDIPFVSIYYRHVLHAYRHEAWQNMTVMPGEGLYHEWLPYHARGQYRDQDNNDNAHLVIAGKQEPASLNPLVATTVWEWKLLRLIYDKLLRVNQQFRPEPWAAAEIHFLEDTVIEVVLRDNMFFHDGQPVRREDVKFTFDFMMENNIHYFDAFLQPIQSVTLTDTNSIRFTLHQAYAPFLAMTLAQIPILPEHLWKDWDSNKDSTVPKIGSGPLVFDSHSPGSSITLRPYPEHFASADMQVTGLTYKIFNDSQAVFTALQEGAADITADTLDAELISLVQAASNLDMVHVPDIGFHFLGFNCGSLPFQDNTLREAAARAMDLDFLVASLLDGYGDAGGPGQPISTGNPYWKNQAIEKLPFDIPKARQILAEAGYTWNEAGQLQYP